MPNFKAILSDLDGTLTDGEHIHQEAFEKICNQLGANVSTKEAASYQGVALDKKYADVQHRFDQPIEYEEFADRVSSYYALKWREIHVIAGAPELLQQGHSQGMRLGAVTNGTAMERDTNLAALGPKTAELLEFVINIDDVKRPKPEPEGYLLGAQRLGIDPKDILALEDTPTGVEAAKAAGMTVIQIQPDPALVSDQADLVVDSWHSPAVAQFIGLDPTATPRRGPGA
ncbi:MAG: HAD family phosphatase [Alphaproteobacteria bacterium]|nr:HAD family phosphatase [Alphaproteobacteria bacterium SS10]